MKAAVIGANGFLGRAVTAHLAAKGWDVCGVDATIPRREDRPLIHWHEVRLPHASLTEVLRKHSPDVLVFAAGTAAVGPSIEDPLGDFEKSVVVWAHLLDCVRRSGSACRTVFLSSAAVYGNPESLPVDERHKTKPVSPYGYHKKMCEEMLECYVNLYGLAASTVRIFSAYGPGLRRQVVWDIYQKAQNGGTVELMGTGSESRDFIHVSDIARAMEVVAEKGDFHGGVYNLGSGTGTTIGELAERVVEALGRTVEIRFVGKERPGDPLYLQADVTKLSGLGFKCQVPLSEGLSDYIGWAQKEGVRAKEETRP